VYYCYHDLDIQEKCDHLIEEISSYVDTEETLYLMILNFRYTHFYSLKPGKGVGVRCCAFSASCISAEFSVFNSLSRQTLGQWSGQNTYSLEVSLIYVRNGARKSWKIGITIDILLACLAGIELQ